MFSKNSIISFFHTAFIFIAINKSCLAQKMFYPGYVVTNNGDTIKGKIPYDIGTNNNYHVIDVKDDKGFVKKFNVWQIKMYSMNNEFYITKKCERGEMQHRNDLVFMHLLQKGNFALYEYEYVRKVGGARNFEEGGFTTGGEKDYYVENKSGEFIYFPRLTYKKVLKEIAKDAPLCMKIIESKDFEYKNIPEVITCLNQ